jgi:hypothetical protein
VGKLGPLEADVARYRMLRMFAPSSSPWWGWLVELGARTRPSAESALASGKHALHWAAAHTGLPVVVVAALTLVVAWRVARRTWHIAFELALAVAALLVATHLGWIRW